MKQFEYLLGKPVMIRTYSAGVHYGTLDEIESGEDSYNVKLVNSRRIYSWTGAFTLSELSSVGSNRTDSKISCKIPSILLKAIEVIEMTPEGYRNLEGIKDYQI